MTAAEGMCRLMSVPCAKLSHTVLPLYVHGEKDGPTVTFTEGEEEGARTAAENSLLEGRKSELTAYFKLCADPNESDSWLGVPNKMQGDAAKNLRYEQIPLFYIWKKVSDRLGHPNHHSTVHFRRRRSGSVDPIAR